MDKLSQRNNIFILVDWNACLPRQFSRVRLFATLWTVACQSLLSMGILQAMILEWVAMLSSKGSSRPWHHTHVFCLLHWQVGSLSLVPPGKSPEQYFSSYLSLKKKKKKKTVSLHSHFAIKFSKCLLSSSILIWSGYGPLPVCRLYLE